MATFSATEQKQVNAACPLNQQVGLGDKIKYLYEQLSADTNGLAFSGTMANGRMIDASGITIGSNTDGTVLSTGTTWLVHATAGQCAAKLLCSSSATSGDYATLRVRGRSDGVNASGGVMGGDFSASANIDDYANLYAVQGVAQPNAKTQANASNIVCGVYARVDRTTTSSGRSWALWVDTHETVKATGGNYLARMSHNGGAINLDGFFTLYAGQGCDYLFVFENNNAPVAAGDKTGGGKSYSIAVKINGTVRYIQCYD